MGTSTRKESIYVPVVETRLVHIEYENGIEYESEALGVLAPNAQGEQVLFIHTQLARKGQLPRVKRVSDYETGQTILVSESWLR